MFIYVWLSNCLLYLAEDLKGSRSECPPKNKAVLEPRSNKENCSKKLFSSPGTKQSFTRHPSLIKLAKSIQDDRRKINSAPSSPARSPLGEFSLAIRSEEDSSWFLLNPDDFFSFSR